MQSRIFCWEKIAQDQNVGLDGIQHYHVHELVFSREAVIFCEQPVSTGLTKKMYVLKKEKKVSCEFIGLKYHVRGKRRH